MIDDNLDRILSQEEPIVPSSGFTARVMEAVEREATEPAPIRFPWMRALPGLIACLALASVLIVSFAESLRHSSVSAAGWMATSRLLPMLRQNLDGSGTLALTAWLVLALVLSLGTMQLALRIAGARK